jgi:hypothetical protein
MINGVNVESVLSAVPVMETLSIQTVIHIVLLVKRGLMKW